MFVNTITYFDVGKKFIVDIAMVCK